MPFHISLTEGLISEEEPASIKLASPAVMLDKDQRLEFPTWDIILMLPLLSESGAIKVSLRIPFSDRR